jgi:hypothetical protein
MEFVHGVNWYNNMRQMAIGISGTKEYKLSFVKSSIVIIGDDLLNGSKAMKILSQNWLYLSKRLGMMMTSRSVGFYITLKILFWLIQLLEN